MSKKIIKLKKKRGERGSWIMCVLNNSRLVAANDLNF